MSQLDDERRVLRFVAERGGPAARMNLAGRSEEIGVDGEAVPGVLAALESRDLIEVLDDGDVHLTPLGRAFVETADP